MATEMEFIDRQTKTNHWMDRLDFGMEIWYY